MSKFFMHHQPFTGENVSKTKPKGNTQWRETVRKINGEPKRVAVRFHKGKEQIRILKEKRVITQQQFDALKATQCRGMTDDLTRCKNLTKNPNGFCTDHINQSKQSEWGKLLDKRKTNKLVLSDTPENRKLWASNPQKYDLMGFDTKLDSDSEEFKKALDNYRNSQIFKAFTEKKMGTVDSDVYKRKIELENQTDEKPWEFVNTKPVDAKQMREDYETEQNEIAFEESEIRNIGKKPKKVVPKAIQCKHITTVYKGGKEGYQQCKRMTKDPSGFCADHNPNGKHVSHGKGQHKFRNNPDGHYHSKDVLEKHLEEIAQAQGDNSDVYLAVIDKVGVDDQLTEDENWSRIKAEIQAAAWA